MLEDKIFQKCQINKEKALEYGFRVENEKMVYRKPIMNHTLIVEIIVIGNKVEGKIFDKELGEEYTSFRVEKNTGEFVNKVREEYQQILEDIKEKCCIEKPYVSKQANRLSEWIKKQYGSSPEFLWKEDSKNSVFRNTLNKKWYGIIMTINKKKLGGEEKEVEVMNVKLPPEEIEELIKKEGYYRAYHMNKKYWITFILDDTISDEELKEKIKRSYQYTTPAKKKKGNE